MLTEVIKRDGRRVPFDALCIRRALLNANEEMPKEDLQATDEEINDIIEDIKNKEITCMNIEDIQNYIETQLMDLKHFDLARAYITYRYKRHVTRHIHDIEKSAYDLIKGNNKDVMTENSNKNALLNSTVRDLMAGELSKGIARDFILSPKLQEAHDSGKIHWHDMDYTAQPEFNCCLIDIKSILEGTVMNNLLIEETKYFEVACNITAQIIASIASNQYGGQSVNLKHLGKYLRTSMEATRERLRKSFAYNGIIATEEQLQAVVDVEVQKQLEQGIQTIQYEVNTLQTTNGQSPFLTLFLHIDEESEYTDEIARIVYEVLRQRLKGTKNKDGVYATPSFPKLIYVLDENNCLKGGKYDYVTELAIDCTMKRMYPDYISAKIMKENYDGEVFSCMGCRSFLSPWKKTAQYVQENGEPESEIGKYKWEGRFNQGVITLNLPRIGIEAAGDMDKFWLLLNERLNICYEALLLRHSELEGTLSDVSPLHFQHGGIARLKPGETIDKLLHDGYSTLSLGYIGLYETVQAMMGVSHTTPEGKAFALKIMHKLRKTCDQWKEDTGLGFGLYGTPAESLCYKFAKLDRAKFGEIKNVTDHNFYTNSYHVFVGEHINAFDKFAFESEFQKISSGGAISYVEIPNLNVNREALVEVVKYGYEHIQYFEFNTKSDYCYNCGFDGEILMDDQNRWKCPCCGNTDMKKMLVTRRTCGYLGQNDWNDGKKSEMKQRVLHL